MYPYHDDEGAAERHSHHLGAPAHVRPTHGRHHEPVLRHEVCVCVRVCVYLAGGVDVNTVRGVD